MSAPDILPAGETALPAGRDVDSAYAWCRRIAHRYGSNFSVGFRFLPREKRRAVYAAYAFCRVADDIADGAGNELSSELRVPSSELTTSNAPEHGARNPEPVVVLASLDRWQSELDACYAGHPEHPVTIALADALERFDIPKSAFVALIDGCRQDMTKHRYASFDELLAYCELVATSISDISLAIFGYRSPAAPDHGRALATALQLTNVTRDVGDDLERDRIYLPQDELARFGVAEEQLQRRVETPQMRALMVFQIDRATEYFRRAEPLLAELDFDARFPTLLMGGVYATVLERLRKDPLIPLRRRVALSLPRKLMVVGTRLLRPHFV
jgi:phytoene synthase